MNSNQVEMFHRNAVITSLVVGPMLLVVASAAKVVNDPDPHAMLTAVAANPGRATLSDAAQLAATVLLVPATVGILRFFRERAAVVGHIAVGLIFINLLGNTADVMHGALLGALARDGVSPADVDVLKALDSTGGAVAVEIMVPLGLLGFPLLAFALWRSRTTPLWVPLTLVAGVVCFFFPINEGLGAAVMGIAFVGLAITIARGHIDSPVPVRETGGVLG